MMKIRHYFYLLFIPMTVLAQPTISITFDDGNIKDMPGYAFEQWNEKILNHLEKHNTQAIFFVRTGDKDNEKGQHLLSSWDKAGHGIANHTVNHPNYNSKKTTTSLFSNELLEADNVINKYQNHVKLFRFPYLKEGNTQEKVDYLKKFMSDHDYSNGHVTIDASDWYIDQRLIKRLQDNPQADIDGYKKYYLKHIYERAMYYEKLSYQLNKRHIKHTLLLHHNLSSALFLGDLITLFKQKGWQITSAVEAYHDPIFNAQPSHSGESLIWALAKDDDNLKDTLRYPAEDGNYEKPHMDQLGL